MEAKFESLLARMEVAVAALEAQAGTTTTTEGPQVPPRVVAYDKYVKGTVDPFVATCKKLGQELDTVGTLVQEGFAEVRNVLMVASHCKKATQPQKMKLFGKTKEKVDAIVKLRGDSRGKEFFPHLSALEDGIKCLYWISVPDTPVNYVKEMVGAASYNLNIVLRKFKNKDNGADHVAFEKQCRAVILNLSKYVKEHHETGMKWNARTGVAFDEAVAKYGSGAAPPATPAAAATSAPKKPSGPPPPAPPAGGPPAPPPVPAGGLPAPSATKSTKPAADTGALFADIRKFSTTGLRKVQKHEKSKYRDPKDKVSTVPSGPAKPAATKKKPAAKKVVKPPRLEYVDDKKWEIEHQVNNKEIKINVTRMSDTVYIFKNTNSFIQIDGKCSSVMIDNCKKTAVVIDSTVASVELVNCQDMSIQIKGVIPMIAIDKTDGCQVYLNPQCKDIPFYTSKSSEMNMLVPSEDDPEDHIEIPIPETFVTRYSAEKKKIHTEVNEV